MSKVKFKVRYNVLLLKEFTIADVLRVTGLNPDSVRTEIQRMIKEGYLVSEPIRGVRGKRGGRPHVYRLTNDLNARMSLSESIEAFYPAPVEEKPTSRYYLSAKRLIDKTMYTDEVSRGQLLSQAEVDLELAEKAEGGNLVPKMIKAHLEIQRARLQYHGERFSEAKEHFSCIRKEYLDVLDDTDNKYIDEYILCLSVCGGFSSNVESKFKDAEFARCLLKVLNNANYQLDSPLISLLALFIRRLLQPADVELYSTLIPSIFDSLSRLEAGQQELIKRGSQNYDYSLGMQASGPELQQEKSTGQQRVQEYEMVQAWQKMTAGSSDKTQ
jgi:hypothetical protein